MVNRIATNGLVAVPQLHGSIYRFVYKHFMLFERFLNPERVSLPDIDIDFDDEGRDKVSEHSRCTHH